MRAVAAVSAGLAIAVASPAAANHRRPISETYEVTAPVPYPGDFMSPEHCAAGVEGVTRDTHALTLPDRGLLEVELTGFLGGWVVELYDAHGRLLEQGAEFDPTNPAPARKLSYQNARPGQHLRIAACNVNGGPNATVRYTFTFR
ncbi:MAG TPA: hypothetical protein VNA12_04475 [Mycobacteriales bacterium]|nr:hypothetical protein [Mycobacteriales bacterium]